MSFMSMYDSTNHIIKGSILTFLYLQIHFHDVKLAYLGFEKSITFVTLLEASVPVTAQGNVENRTCLYLNFAFVE